MEEVGRWKQNEVKFKIGCHVMWTQPSSHHVPFRLYVPPYLSNIRIFIPFILAWTKSRLKQSSGDRSCWKANQARLTPFLNSCNRINPFKRSLQKGDSLLLSSPAAMYSSLRCSKLRPNLADIFRTSYPGPPRRAPWRPVHHRPLFTRGFSLFRPDFRTSRSICGGIIGINILVLGAWNGTGHDGRRWLVDNCTLSMRNWRAGRYWTIITSAFSHMGVFHFAGNMICLWTFWSILSTSPYVSAASLITLAAGSSICSGAAQLHHQPNSVGLGASGMVMGIGAAAACYAPRWPVAILFIPIQIPLWVAVGGYFLYDYYYLKTPSNVGHAAHLGGFAFGAAYGLLLRGGGVLRIFR